jgi:ABC-type enterochelin transport system permease subunit
MSRISLFLFILVFSYVRSTLFLMWYSHPFVPPTDQILSPVIGLPLSSLVSLLLRFLGYGEQHGFSDLLS